MTPGAETGLRDYSLLDALRQRRARRFACGMQHDRGPLAYTSERDPFPLSEEEIAALAFAARGVTGYALAELVYHPGSGSDMRYPLGLERNGVPVLVPYAPPYYRTMREAVLAVVERKFGERGVFRGGIAHSGYKEPAAVASAAHPLSYATIEATIAYCEYISQTYGRFPAYPAAFRTSVGFQASHLDAAFYERFYRPEALGDPQREHMQRWHARAPQCESRAAKNFSRA